jgi:hypothetical protein
MHSHLTPKDIERFWSRVDKTDSCWLWTGGLFDDDYGAFRIAGKSFRAHRVSWMIAHGDIPDGLFVCHNCPDGDNPQCVNPAHLWTGTNQENMDDMIAKGRSLTGDRNPSRIYPEAKPRGDQHWTRTNPELLARGDANGSRKYPDRILRGDQHPFYSHPELRARGERSGQAKLNADKVREIRQRYAAGGVSQGVLGAEFGVSGVAISCIIRRKTWMHVE